LLVGNFPAGEVAAVADQDAEPEWISDKVDVSGLSLRELRDADESPLVPSLRRIAADLAGPDEPIAGFNSAL
jgi:FXSXX-COOH protein